MNHKLTPSTAALLTVPPLLWAGNAIVGRLLRDAVPPMTLNFLRWALALCILLPLARTTPGLWHSLRTNWRRYALLGLLGVGVYNSLQYLALQTSTPINVTLVAAGMPVWMMLVGRLFFGARVGGMQLAGAVVSIAGVLVVLCHGDLELLRAMRLVPGDLFMVLATIMWSFYTWLLTEPKDSPSVRASWAGFLFAQVLYGVLWSGVFTAAEWTFTPARFQFSWTVAAGLAYVAIGPAVTAFRCWGAGVQRAGPSAGAFFSNLTPLFAALFSSAFLGAPPQPYHALAFILIVGGIVLSAKR